MRLREWDDFLNETADCVKFVFDRAEIKKELAEHMEDIYDDLVSDGINEKEAACKVLEHMGSPKEIGEELNRVHSPFLGWVWYISRIAAVLVLVVLGIKAASFGVNAAMYYLDDNEYAKDASLVYEVEVDEEFELDDITFIIENVRLYDNGEMVIEHRTKKDLLSRSIDWSFNITRGCFKDENGTDYLVGSGYSRNTVLGQRGFTTISDFDSEADVLIFDYDRNGRKFYCEISLKEAKEAAK